MDKLTPVNATDIFCHWAPPDYGAAALQAAGRPLRMLERALAMPVMTDLDARLRLMDQFPGYRQVPCLVSPPLEALAGPEQAAELARRANDGMAAMATRHPARFPGFFAALALNHPEAMLTEARRAVTELGACGVQIFTNMNGAAIDTPPFMGLFALMAELDRPLLLHPTLGMETPERIDAAVPVRDPWIPFMDAWHAYLCGGAEPPFSGRNNLKAFAMLSAAIESVETGGPVRISENPSYAAAFAVKGGAR